MDTSCGYMMIPFPLKMSVSSLTAGEVGLTSLDLPTG